MSAPKKGTRTCSVEGCERKHNAKGWCAMHLARVRRGSPMDNPAKGEPWTCSVATCDAPGYGKRMCRRHYGQAFRYGMNAEQLAVWDTLVCESCGSGYRLHTDHDHATGAVRGRLCNNCNVALGLLNDSPERILGLLTYALKVLGGIAS